MRRDDCELAGVPPARSISSSDSPPIRNVVPSRFGAARRSRPGAVFRAATACSLSHSAFAASKHEVDVFFVNVMLENLHARS